MIPVQHKEAHGFTQGQVALIHPIVDSCLSVLRSEVWNMASRVKLLIHEAILKLNMPISTMVKGEWRHCRSRGSMRRRVYQHWRETQTGMVEGMVEGMVHSAGEGRTEIGGEGF